VDRLNIVAHDKFQEIIDEANRPGSTIRLQQVVLGPDQLEEKTVTVVSRPQLVVKLGIEPEQTSATTFVPLGDEPPAFSTVEEQKIAQITFDVIRGLESQPKKLPNVNSLQKQELQVQLVREVSNQYRPTQMELEGVIAKPDIAAIVLKTTQLVIQQTIDIPRILVVPTGEVRSGFKSFTLDAGSLKYPPVGEELWIQHLRTNQFEVLTLGKGGIDEARLEDYIVSGLVDFDDVSYDNHADLLYELAGQAVKHFLSYLSEEETKKVLRFHQRDITRFIHAQMQQHYWEETGGHEVRISKGFSELRPSAFTASASDPVMDFRQAPADKSNMAKYVFGGFKKCLYPVQKFQSDSERKLALILDREALKWFKPAKGQFQIFYKSGADQLEYQPDFVAEVESAIYMLEPKARNEMADPDVLAKRDSAVNWCKNASDHAASYGGKRWNYALIPHDAISENMTVEVLASNFGTR
jgi:type III restriction enzyme